MVIGYWLNGNWLLVIHKTPAYNDFILLALLGLVALLLLQLADMGVDMCAFLRLLALCSPAGKHGGIIPDCGGKVKEKISLDGR